MSLGLRALQERDERLGRSREMLISARNLVRDTHERHRSRVTGPAAAVELLSLAERLAALAEPCPSGQDNPALLRRAAILSAGEEWDRLGAMLPALRLAVTSATAALGDTAVQMNRLGRPRESTDPVDGELGLLAAKIGAESAYAAADSAFLPSLSDFLR
jgi:hypothetical protein